MLVTKEVKFRLEPEDEYTHPIEEEKNFNESMYINIFDPSSRLGGWFRVGNRPNEGYAEMKGQASSVKRGDRELARSASMAGSA